MTKYKVSFPHLGNYYVPLERLFTRGLNVDYVVPPLITKKRLWSWEALIAPTISARLLSLIWAIISKPLKRVRIRWYKREVFVVFGITENCNPKLLKI